jgi:hypothetical protein
MKELKNLLRAEAGWRITQFCFPVSSAFPPVMLFPRGHGEKMARIEGFKDSRILRKAATWRRASLATGGANSNKIPIIQVTEVATEM